jgi:hypothetical protein
MRAAVDKILADPVAAAKRAEAAREVVLDRYSATTFVNLLDGILTDFTAAMVES